MSAPLTTTARKLDATEAPDAGAKCFLVTIQEWVSNSVRVQAYDAEEAQTFAEALFDDLGPEVFDRFDGGINGVDVLEVTDLGNGGAQ